MNLSVMVSVPSQIIGAIQCLLVFKIDNAFIPVTLHPLIEVRWRMNIKLIIC